MKLLQLVKKLTNNGKAHKGITTIRPLKMESWLIFIPEQMIRGFIKMINRKKHYFALKMVMYIPSGITEVEKEQ